MSKFEAELRLPCKQPYAYISIWVRGETAEEFKINYLTLAGSSSIEDLTKLHGVAYDVAMGTKRPVTIADMDVKDPRDLIVTELGGKVIEEKATPEASPAQKPWERSKPATKAKADPNDPFASFK